MATIALLYITIKLRMSLVVAEWSWVSGMKDFKKSYKGFSAKKATKNYKNAKVQKKKMKQSLI